MNDTIKRPRMRRWPSACGLAVLLVLLSFADRRGWLLVRVRDDLTAYDGVAASVVRVFDGDSFEVDLPDALRDCPVTGVRLWGLDCREAAHRDRAAEAWSSEASALTRALLAGSTVILHLEPHRRRGVFGRVLAHVELPDGSTLNERLLSEGLAAADDRWPHAMLVRYEQAERKARRAGRGIWSRVASASDAE